MKRTKSILKKLLTICRYTFAALFIAVGILGLVVSYINPMGMISPILPINITGSLSGVVIAIDQALVQSWLAFLHTYLIYTIAISSATILVGLSLMVRDIKAWGRGIKAAPMGIVRSPVRAYRRVSIWRNWLLAKITYLNETRSTPSEIDYDRGFFVMYFARQANDKNSKIFEIAEKDFKRTTSFYIKRIIELKITGDRDLVEKNNKLIIDRFQLNNVISPLQFYRPSKNTKESVQDRLKNYQQVIPGSASGGSSGGSSGGGGY